MKIAYVGNFRHSHCTEVHVKASLEALGHVVHPLQEDTMSWATVPRFVQTRKCELLLWTRTWGDKGTATKSLQWLRNAGVPSVSFHLDRWWGLEREYQLSDESFFKTDLVVTAERGRDEDWQRLGINHAWLPPGVFHAECGTVAADHERFPHDVVFVGSHPYPHPGWEPYRTSVITAAQQRYGDRFRVWPDPGKPIRGRDLQALYASCKVVIGDSCLEGDVTHYWSDRIPETLGRGGCLVHPRVEGLAEWYTPSDLVTYELGDVRRLLNAVDLLLEDDRLRGAIATHGRATVLNRDTYVHRMQTVLAWVDDMQAGRALAEVDKDPMRLAVESGVGLLHIPDDIDAAALEAAFTDAAEGQMPIIVRGDIDAVRLIATSGSCEDCLRVAHGMAVCAICGSPMRTVLCLGNAPIANRLRVSENDDVPRHPLHVAQCTSCGTVQLASRPPAETLFDADYPYRSSQSRTMLASASRLAQYVTQALSLSRDDLVLEIGSNDGYLLKHYQRLGARVLGYDPAREAAMDAVDQGVETMVEFFDSKAGERLAGQATVVHANNVLAHVDDPDDLTAGMAAALHPHKGVLIIETPWLMPLLDDGAFDTIYHEHRFYWSVHALEQLLRRNGMRVVGVEQHPQLHGGTLRVFAERSERASVGDGRCMAWLQLLALERAAGLEDDEWANRYAIIHRGQVEKLRRWWQGVNPISGYGAAAKATVMLHVLDVKAPLFVVDSTPAKQHKWTPCGSLVLPPEELARRMPPDCVIFPWNFADEITRRAHDYVETGGRLWTLIPDVRRVA